MVRLFLLTLCLCYFQCLFAQSEKVTLCNSDHYHPVDIKAKQIVDSLIAKGIDTVLIYRHWLGTNGFNGYGKVLWMDNQKVKEYRINFVNWNKEYGIKSISYSESDVDTVFSFYFRNRVDTVNVNPKKQEMWMSHDADHFVWISEKGRTYCYNISGLLVRYNPIHLRSQLVNKLTNLRYIEETDIQKSKGKRVSK